MFASREVARLLLVVAAAIVLWAAGAVVAPAVSPTAEFDPEAVKHLEAAYPAPPDGRFDMPISTRIAASGEKAARFVPGPSELVRYNSRLTLVVMVPAGCEVQWRVWSAGRGFANAADHPSKNTQ